MAAPIMSGVRAKTGQFNAGIGQRFEQQIFGNPGAHRVQQEGSGLADAATQNDDLGIQEGDDGVAGLGQIIHIGGEHLHGRIIQLSRRIEHDLGVELFRITSYHLHHQAFGMLLENLLAHPDNGRGAAVALQAAFVAACAGNAADIHGNVADLAAYAVEAAPRTAVDDDAAAYAGAQRQEHAGGGALAEHARDALGKAGHGGVVVDKDGLIDVFLELAAQRNVLPSPCWCRK